MWKIKNIFSNKNLKFNKQFLQYLKKIFLVSQLKDFTKVIYKKSSGASHVWICL